MKNPFSIKDKTFLITGASSGIGKDIAISIARQGGRVLISGRNGQRLIDTYSQLFNQESHFIEAYDLNNIEGISDWVSRIISKYNIRFDGFVHCAGINILKPLLNISTDDFEEVTRINFFSGIELLKNVANPKNCNPGSSFIFISSVSGLIGEPCSLAYCASKAALISSVKTAAIELGRFKHRVNCIAPGMVDTPMLKEYKELLDNSQLLSLQNRFPLGLGDTLDVSNAAIFLLSDASRWITGTTMVVDGGYTCGK